MSLTHNGYLCSDLVPLSVNSAVDTKLRLCFNTTPGSLVFPHIVGESPEMSQSGTAFAGVQLVGYSLRAYLGGPKFFMGRRLDSRLEEATRDGKANSILKLELVNDILV
jgi:hypothetical protein